ncbi:hypothetical protein J31TS4_45690 [Paenibacillus sp. J31TS4]|uniref:YheC/YheD family protein n=1 Tax=Paenibacillus sp. J31TS4 TaxID=2807195 RepID=UPI001B1F0B8A|nr:YheC/YheD family protein [Paenibacillus sp. J31TS4]GIP41289.1 hypothetical protein J31TS4_45690 [Paenibacillus sp. J31TS4]
MASATKHIASKWVKHTLLARDPYLRGHLPKTRLLTKRTFYRYLKRYSSIYLKPVYGTHGNGIVKIQKNRGRYLVQSGRSKRYYRSRESVAYALSGLFRRPYLIQKGVHMLKLGKRPVDFRMLMLKPDRNWIHLGVIGKRAAPKKVVTNLNSGGRAVSVYRVLVKGKGYSHRSYGRTLGTFERIGRQVARTFSHRYPRVRKLGLDLAVDRSHRTWILEANTNPGFQLFRRHPDPGLYSRIARIYRDIRRR